MLGISEEGVEVWWLSLLRILYTVANRKKYRHGRLHQEPETQWTSNSGAKVIPHA